MKPTIIREVLDQRGNVVLPFTPKMLWDITKDPKIMVYDEDGVETGEYKAVEPWVIDLTRQGLAVSDSTWRDRRRRRLLGDTPSNFGQDRNSRIL